MAAELTLMVNLLYCIMSVALHNYDWCLALRSVLSTSWIWPKKAKIIMALELDNDVEKLIEGGTLVRDCAYLKKLYIATPLKGCLHGHKDAYNF